MGNEEKMGKMLGELKKVCLESRGTGPGEVEEHIARWAYLYGRAEVLMEEVKRSAGSL